MGAPLRFLLLVSIRKQITVDPFRVQVESQLFGSHSFALLTAAALVRLLHNDVISNLHISNRKRDRYMSE